MRQHTTTVLVVGAGPSGLAVAAALRRLGIEVMVVDAAPERASGSRAILLWPPVIDALAELGVGARALDAGYRARALAYHLDSGHAVTVALSDANAPLVLPQERTSVMLEEALRSFGGDVVYGVRVEKVAPRPESVAVSAVAQDGTAVEIEADWLIGADGLHSQVRQQLGLEFEGRQLPTTFLLAEGTLSGRVATDEIHYFLSSSGVLLIAPLPGGVFRISGAIAPDTPVSRELVQRLLDERGPGGLRVGELDTLTTFVSDERVASSLRVGRCFLVGDAGHVHSAIGGQGLNLGIQDARSLAWRLAGVIDGRLAPAVLDSYEPERLVAIRQILLATGRMARQAVAGPLARRTRDVVWRLAESSGALARWYAPMLAGWRTPCPDPLATPEPASPRRRRVLRARSLPPAGTRRPDWRPVPDHETAGRLQLVVWGPPAGVLARRAGELAERFADLVVTRAPDRRRGEGFVLLRPDGYVAASGTAEDFGAVTTLLDRMTPTRAATESR